MLRTSHYERTRPFQPVLMDLATPGAGDLHPGAGDLARHRLLLQAVAIGRSAAYLQGHGDPDRLAGRYRAPGAGTDHRPHRAQIAGDARRRFPAQLFAPGPVAIVL